uniref:Uncharacterized protein n=1 Tax=Schistosoma haematobium TaxID=6185 RepID=A0A095C8S5_SCHHA
MDAKRYHHYHHMYNQPASIQHQHHKPYETLDPELYSNLGQNRTIREECPPIDSEIHVPSMDKTCIITGNSLPYIDEYQGSPVEHYSRFNRSPREWINKETDDIRISQEELTTLIRHTGNNSRKHELPLTTTFQPVSSTNYMSLAFNQLAVDKFHDPNLNTVSSASSFMPPEVNSSLPVSFPRLPTNIPASRTLDYSNTIWRNYSNLKMNNLFSDTNTQINISDNTHASDDSIDDEDNDKQPNSRVSLNHSKLEYSRHINNQSEHGSDVNLSAWSLLQFSNDNNQAMIDNNNNNHSNILMSSGNVESTNRIRDEN